MNYKVLFLILFTLTHLYQLVLNVVQHRSANHPTPANVADVYDDATYQKWRAYHGEKSRLDILRTGVSWVLTMALLLSDAYAWNIEIIASTSEMHMTMSFFKKEIICFIIINSL